MGEAHGYQKSVGFSVIPAVTYLKKICSGRTDSLPLLDSDVNAMKELTIQDIETIIHRDENRIMEAKKTTGEIVAGMQSGCAFLNTEGVNEAVNEGVNDRLNDRLNDELSPAVRSTYLIIKENPGIQRKELSEKSGKSIPTIDRYLAELQEKGFIVHEGSRKTGGYYVK